MTTLRVGTSQTYSNLQSALDNLSTINDPDQSVVIAIYSGTYNETNTYAVNFNLLPNIESLTIKKAGDSEVVILKNDSNNDLLTARGTNSNVNLTIQGLIFSTDNLSPNANTTAISLDDRFNNVIIKGCTFNNYNNSIINGTYNQQSDIINSLLITENTIYGRLSSISRSFVWIYNPITNLTISNNHVYRSGKSLITWINSNSVCIIEGNTFDPTFNANVQDGDSFIYYNSYYHYSTIVNSNLYVNNNIFYNTYILYENSNALISNNYFIKNSLLSSLFIVSYQCSTCMSPIGNSTISNNIFKNNNSSTESECFQFNLTGSNSDHSYKIINNSLFNITNLFGFDFALLNAFNPIREFRNNLIQNVNSFGSIKQYLNNVNTYPNFPTPVLSENCFYSPNYISSANLLTTSSNTTNFSGDPQITMQLENGTYSLNWDSTQKSPLIMNSMPVSQGWGTISSNIDYFYDRSDIGSVQYSANPHQYIEYKLPKSTENSGIRWMCFPVVENVYNPTSNDPDYAYNFFSPIFNDQKLDNIQSKIGNQNKKEIKYSINTWINADYQVLPSIGHKVKVNSTYNQNQYLYKNAHKPNVNTIIPLYALQQNSTTVNENWVGYFCETTKSVQDAFGSFYNDNRIYQIQHQYWTASRDPKSHAWTIAAQAGKPVTLKYGDMVIIKCSSDINNFTWGQTGAMQEEYVRAQTSNFTYEEKADYIPIYASINSSEAPSEIAVFIDDVCKGAAVVTDTLVEIPAYIVDDLPNNPELEIRMSYNSKNIVNLPSPAFYNENNNSYVTKLKVSEKKDFFRVEIGKEIPIVNPEYKLTLSNYPNPFNPNTTISFQIPESKNIDVNIYNVKGQLVKNIFKGHQEKGSYQMHWDGKDHNNKSVASGIYYASLKINNKNIVRKMLLMK